MTRRARKIISILMTLMLIFTPLESVYAGQEHNCDNSDVASNTEHQHSNYNVVQDHHGQELTVVPDSRCAFCADKQCCCDSSSCSCIGATSMFAQSVLGFKLNPNLLSSSIPFYRVHHIHYDAAPLLRPPIA